MKYAALNASRYRVSDQDHEAAIITDTETRESCVVVSSDMGWPKRIVDALNALPRRPKKVLPRV